MGTESFGIPKVDTGVIIFAYRKGVENLLPCMLDGENHCMFEFSRGSML